jgi:hypothetical protein
VKPSKLTLRPPLVKTISRFFVALIVLLSHLFAATAQSTSFDTVTLAPVEDAFVRNGTSSAINYGTNDTLAVKTYNTSANFTRYAYLKFNLAASDVAKATLRVYGKNIENNTAIIVTAFGADDDSWTETGIIWDNAPASLAIGMGTMSVNNVAQYRDIDVTEFVKAQATGDQVATLVLKVVSTNTAQYKGMSFNSRENAANQPQLVVISNVPVVPPPDALSFAPTSLSFSVEENGTTTAQNATLSANNGTPTVALAKSANSDWLILPSPALGSLSFGIDATGLAAGTYNATVTATAAGYTDGVMNVSLQVTPAAKILSFSPDSVHIHAVQNGSASDPASTLSASSGAPTVSLSKSANSDWLILPAPGLGSLSFDVDVTGLTPGTYTSIVTASATDYTDGTLKVVLEVSPDPSLVKVLSFSPDSLSFSLIQGGSAPAKGSNLSATNGNPTVAFEQSANSSWLVAPSPALGSLSFNVNASGLAPGIYNGSVIVSATDYTSDTIKVRLEVTPASTNTVTVSAVADAFVRNGTFAAINYGLDDTIAVKTYNTGPNFTRIGYFKFPVNFNNVTTAKLRVYGKNIENTTAIVVSAFGADDSWTETGINFNNAPASDATVLSTVSVNNTLQYREFDVTSFIQQEAAGDKLATLVLKVVSTNTAQYKGISFNSRENIANQPELVVMTTDVGTPNALSFAPTSLAFSAQQNGSATAQSATLSANNGTPTVALVKSANSDWLVLPSPALGSLSFNINTAGLAPGTYHATVTATSSGYSDAMLNISLEVTPVPTNTVTIAPIADAFVRNGTFAAINYGTDDTIAVKTYNTGPNFTRVGYFKFPVNFNNVTSAKLRVYGKNIENTTAIVVSAFGADDDSWTETVINFNNAPASQATALSTASVNNVLQYREFDVTSFIQQQAAGDKTATLVLQVVSTNSAQYKGISFNSRENAANQPQLVVETTDASVPNALSFTPNTLSFTAEIDNSTGAKSATLAANNGAPVVALAKSANSDWLILPSPGLGSLSFGVNTTGLAIGTYNATVTASAAGYTDATLSISLEIKPQAQTLSFSPDSIHFDAIENATVNNKTSTLSANTGTPTIALTKSANSNWLVLPASPSLGLLSFGINTTGLTAGTYNATVTASATNYSDGTLKINLVVSPAGSTVTLTPIADAYVRNGTFAAQNFGSDPQLAVKTFNGGQNFTRIAYLKFDLPVSTVYSAKLRVFGKNPETTAAMVMSVQGANDDSWTESGINFNNAPASSTATLSTISVNDQEKYYELDVTSFINAEVSGDKIATLILKDATNQNVLLAFNSKEQTANKPELVIETQAPKSLSFSDDSLVFSTVQNGTAPNQTITLSASTGTPAITLTKTSNSNWLTLPSSPALGNLSFGINSAGLPTGTFNATVTASASGYIAATFVVQLKITPESGAKTIVFVRSTDSVEVQQGGTQQLLEYIAATDSTPVSTTLNATRDDGSVPNWISVNGNLISNLNYTAGSEITFNFDATNLSTGVYTAKIIATATGYNSGSLDIVLTVKAGSTGIPVNIKVNFQDAATVPPAGWVRDFGQPFGPRTSANQGTGNIYGWIRRSDGTPLDLTLNGRKRNTPADILQATLMHMQGQDVANFSGTPIEGIWEIQAANGDYDVTVSVGDGTAIDSRHSINIEGVPAIINFVPTTAMHFKEATISVSVADGLLTMDAIGGQNTKVNYIIITPTTTKRPSVVVVNPENGTSNVSENSSISTLILNLPNGGINNNTLNDNNVYLTKAGDDLVHIPANVNGTGGGDAITLVPSASLQLNTTYFFHVTDGVKDLSGASFIPYTSSFTTTQFSTTEIVNAKFNKVVLSNATGQHSSLVIGPDHKLYAVGIDGVIKRFTINADGTLQNPQLIFSLQDAYGPRTPRLAIGFAFAPEATAGNLVAYVTHSTYTFLNGPDWDGKLTRLSGANLQNVQDILINLPRSAKDHLTNSIAFGPDGKLYFTQGCNSAMGRADATWQNRDEHLLSGSVLQLDLTKLGSLPLDVKTESGGSYNPYSANAPLKIYASGVRNAYDLVWHTNGELYVPTNGSAAGGNTPASVAGTLRPDGSTYNGPSIPALTNVAQTQKDFLFRVVQGGYYGHPNPRRGEYVLNGGNPTSAIDPAQVDQYPLGTLPDANYRGYAFDFQTNKSPNGAIEYKSNSFNGALKGKLMVVRYSQNDDIITLTIGSNKNISGYIDGASIQGFSGFVDPLDLVEDVSNGNIYVSEYGGDGKITLLVPTVKPTQQPGSIAVSPQITYTNTPTGGGVGGTRPVVIKNVGTGPLSVTAITLGGTNASQFTLSGLPTLPASIPAGDSISINVGFQPSSVGIKLCTVNIASNDTANANVSVAVRGLGTAGSGGSNEPSLQAILGLYQMPVNVGDDDAATTVIHSNTTTQKAALLGEEVSIPKFFKAAGGNVTIQPLAVFGPTTSNPVLTFGWYLSGDANSRQQLLTVSNSPASNGQTVNPNITGNLSFDPDAASFGFYTSWPSLSNRLVYSEDNLNTFTGAVPHHVRVYKYKDTSGNVVPNTYIVAFEETTSALDYQDLVFVVSNVKSASQQDAALAPVADAFVRNGSFAAQNFGADSLLTVKTFNTSTGFTRASYLKFSLGNVTDVLSAKLRIYGRNTDNSTLTNLSLYTIANDGWSELGINFNNAPAVSGSPLATFGVNNVGKYFEFDVTQVVKTQFDGDKLITFVINDPTNQNRTISFNSKENIANRPQLVITTTASRTTTGAALFVENLDKFPANDYFAASKLHFKTTRDTVPPFVYNSNHDTIKIRLHNKGTSPLVITNLIRSNTNNWIFMKLKGVDYNPSTALPLTIASGTFADLTMQFVQATDLHVRIQQFFDALIIQSNDDKEPVKTIQLAGLWQRLGEGSSEPRSAEMIAHFGFKTQTGFTSSDPDDGDPKKPKGDEIISSYFTRADPLKPVYVIQMSAYHGCCRQSETIRWYTKGSTTLNAIFTHNAIDAQSLLPTKGAARVPADGSFSTNTTFGFKVGSTDWTDTLKNPDRKIGIRVWKAIDGKGNIIPNEYIIANDYLGSQFTNYDYNDNLYYVKNIKPEIGTANFSVLGPTPSALDFGEQTLGGSGGLTLTVKNLGITYANGSSDPAINIFKVEIVGENSSEFGVSSPAQATLNVQQTTTLPVTFNPSSQGLKIADLLIYHTGSASPLRVPLYGIAKAPGVTVVVNRRIKSGSTTAVTVNGKTFSAETGFAFDNLEPFTNAQVTQIAGTDEDVLYLREQSSNGDKKPFRYQIPLPNGNYVVRLHFAEIYWGAPGGGVNGGPGSRVMGVTIENVPKLINFDVAAEVGTATAIIKNIPVTVADGNLNINWSATVNRPMICAVEVYSFTGAAPISSPATVSMTETTDSKNDFEKPRIYPNPLKDRFHILFPTTYYGKVNLLLSDVRGKTFEIGHYLLNPGGSNMEVDVSKLALTPGVYFLQIRLDKKTDVIKLIIK